MALETLAVQPITRSGKVVTRVPITTVGGVNFANNGKTFLLVLNDAGALLLTFTITVYVDGQTGLTRPVTVTAAEDWTIGPFPVDQYNDANGMVYFVPDANLAAAAVAAVSL